MSEEQQTEKPFISIPMPEIFPGMKQAKIVFWAFEEDEVEVVEPNDLLLRVETEHAFFDVSVPSWVTTRCRVQTLHKKVGEEARPGELLMSLEPL